MFETAIITFQVTRDGKPAAPIVLAAGVPENAAVYLRTSEIKHIDIEWIVPDLQKPDELTTMDGPKLILPPGQHFLENKIDLSKKSGKLRL
jgi:hypothetical protein